MEDLTRLVTDSLARHGFAAALDHRRLEWSRWFRCESSFSLLLVPSAAGLYALGEEVIAPGELPSASGKRLLAVFQVSETEDLCVALSRLFAPRNPLSARLSSGRCFVRFTLVADSHQRHTACESLSRWLSTTAETVEAQAETSRGTTSAVSPGRKSGDSSEKLLRVPSGTTPEWSADLVPQLVSTKDTECEPPPLPAGF